VSGGGNLATACSPSVIDGPTVAGHCRLPVTVLGSAGSEAPLGGDPRQPLTGITEAEREGRLGEIEGLKVILAVAEAKIAHLDARQERRSSKVFVGVPSFHQIAARTGGEP
jgi:hypothetical protein